MLDQIEGQRIQGEKVILVTFNYDTLLEHAIIDSIIGISLNTIPDYIASDYKVIKPHGSINWAHPIRNFKAERSLTQDLVSDIIESSPILNIDGGFYEIVSENPFERPAKPLFPALAIPVVHKQRYECPQEHWKVLEQYLPEVTKTLIIGWRAGEDSFLDSLAKGGLSKRGSIMVVSGSERGADEVIARMRDRWGLTFNSLVAAKSEGFSKFIFSSEWETFLKAGEV
jgi:hypothetical protein